MCKKARYGLIIINLSSWHRNYDVYGVFERFRRIEKCWKNKGGNRVKSYNGACDYVVVKKYVCSFNTFSFSLRLWLIDGRPFSISHEKSNPWFEKGQNVEHVVYDKQMEWNKVKMDETWNEPTLFILFCGSHVL